MQELKKNILQILNNEKISEREVSFQIKKLLFENEMFQTLSKESRTISSLVDENISKLIKINKSENNDFFIETGFKTFDLMFNGLSYGEYVVIGGRPSMGKTQLLVSITINVSSVVPVLFFSFDLSEYLLTTRFLSSMSDISITQLLHHKLTEDEKKIVSEAGENINNKKIFVNDSCSNSLSAFKHYCLKHIEEDGVKLIVVDYIQMMNTGKFRNYKERELEISYISRELKNIAKNNNVCIIASSQLNRSVESRSGDKKPMLSDLRESGALEQDADKVIFIHRPEYYGFIEDMEGNSCEGIIDLIVAKNRNGRLGEVKLIRNNNFTNIKDFDTNKNQFDFSETRINEIDKPF